MRLLLLASVGGAVGAAMRYLLSFAFLSFERLAAFPWATLTINVSGSVLMGALVGVFLRHWPDAVGMRIFLTTGILGGFTTFSAFAMEVVALTERGQPTAAIVYAMASVGLSIGGCLLGLLAVRTI
jgi:CrcB protein